MSVLGIRDRVLTFDEARRVAVNVATLPALPAAWRLRTTGFIFQARTT